VADRSLWHGHGRDNRVEEVKAAVLEAGRQPLTLADDVDIASPAPGQVLVRVTHCGLCHSDLTLMEVESPNQIPIVLGHEAAGVVEEVGIGVTSVKPGDHVVAIAMAGCGHCYFCVRGENTLCPDARAGMAGVLGDGTTPLSRRGAIVYRGLGVGGFAQMLLTTQTGVVRIDDDVPLELAAVIGCAVQTGVGAVLNAAKVEAGATVLVMGLGGIGISVVQGARIANASRIIVSDPNPDRRNAAVHFGATDVLDPGTDDVIAASYRLTRGIGVDYAFDAAGHAALVTAGVFATRPGGTTVMVGAPPADQALTINPAVLMIPMEKKIVGTLYGTGNPARNVPLLLSMWRRGVLDLESMISFRRPLHEINDGFEDLRHGRGIRTVLEIS
jgi:S-(hydroxymethyl)glutathione dehydrogenase/alcohol dehydrogenase